MNYLDLKAQAEIAHQEALELGLDSAVFLKLAQRVRERCAVDAWTFYMERCKSLGLSPSLAEGWCAATAIRGSDPEKQPAVEPQDKDAQPQPENKAVACLLWLLWQHQGSHSPIGVPIRRALGMGPSDPLTPEQVSIGQRFGVGG